MKKIILSCVTLALVLSLQVTPVAAQEDIGDLIKGNLDPIEDIYDPRDEVSPDTLAVSIAKIIRTVLGFLSIIFLILIVYAGFMWMTSRGNDEQIGKAKKTLSAAIIGVTIVLAAYIITAFVISELLSATTT